MGSLIRLDTVTSRPLTWLWYPRIPAGRLSIVFGHPDRGKSIFAITCATHISLKRLWPDGADCPDGTVIILEAEDSLEETIVPRLQVAGANLTNIYTWADRNTIELAKYVAEVKPALVILSPLNTYLPKTTNTWQDHSVRAALQPLADLATSSGAAILGIMHPPKAQHTIPIHAIVGSIAFGAVARSVLLIDRTPEGLYLVEGIKRNLTQDIPPIGFRIVPSLLNPTLPILQWEVVAPSMSLVPPDEEQSALSMACEYLNMALDEGPVSSTLIRFGAEKQGISLRTLSRARKMLAVIARPVYSQDKSHWWLSLPSISTNRLPLHKS